ncbi:UDP-N-acetylmuramate dehydrogenase [Ruminococcaceae bacterium OttesenSCG-928-L11]|nr:UDP-N-acetylmuramate dehydrogenase [Ruminococcaceae bacterium OttesenSCG-928-L11]
MDIASILTPLCRDHGMELQRDVPLSTKCTFKIGGPAAFYLEPATEQALARIVAACHEHAVPCLVLGKGSNVLFSDDGFHGVVIGLGELFSAIALLDDTTVFCQSGASLSRLCCFARDHGLAGLEFAYGIPGSVGGAVYMNAGAYGGEIADCILRATHIDADGTPGTLEREALALSYRHSAYSGGNRVITGAVFRLAPGDREEIAAKMADYMNRRRTKQPLDLPSAGSTFKRPEGAYASALIDQCGLKGRSVGGAQVSEKHAGFVVNTGGATCADVEALIAEVVREVQAKTGFLLEPEVRIIRP